MIGLGIVRKITVDPNDTISLLQNFTIDIFLENFRDFETLFWIAASKAFAQTKHVQNWH